MAIQELDIIPIKELLKKTLSIPVYQRPYTWQEKTVNTLFNDILTAYNSNVKEQRLGTVILYDEGKDNYEIVDGQQRIITLVILLYILAEEKKTHDFLNELSYLNNFKLPSKEYSKDKINSTYSFLKKKISKISIKKDEFIKYIADKCTIALIVTDNLAEAFQFFDSQNSRGKGLQPHDLLKAYHLREMNSSSVDEKIHINNEWMKISEDKLKMLFSVYLYPIIMWSKNKNGLYYSSKNIDTFKGIRNENLFNYALYHKASHQYTASYNELGHYRMCLPEKINQFQLTQPVIAGSIFFKYTIYYYNLLVKIRKKIEVIYEAELIPDVRTGDKYVKNLFEAVLLFFADRFGFNELTIERMNIMYAWAYILRLELGSVYETSINKHALGRHENCAVFAIFEIIHNMTNPDEILDIDITLNESQKNKYENKNDNKYYKIYEKIKKILGLSNEETNKP